MRLIQTSAMRQDIDSAAKYIGAGAATVGVAGAGKFQFLFFAVAVVVIVVCRIILNGRSFSHKH